jgi:hypothetical protein
MVQQEATNKTTSSQNEELASTGPIFYDLNATDTETFVMDSIGPALRNGTLPSIEYNNPSELLHPTFFDY